MFSAPRTYADSQQFWGWDEDRSIEMCSLVCWTFVDLLIISCSFSIRAIEFKDLAKTNREIVRTINAIVLVVPVLCGFFLYFHVIILEVQTDNLSIFLNKIHECFSELVKIWLKRIILEIAMNGICFTQLSAHVWREAHIRVQNEKIKTKNGCSSTFFMDLKSKAENMILDHYSKSKETSQMVSTKIISTVRMDHCQLVLLL